uniref:Uncharacterized protein n=1 Tax=Chromera velia CCMP2878 TaxID=1169474 RepID=A0A0G4HQK0_9ALVE|eukprot:Cvel_7927.t1-p1 / transcript=Cvel_7927.t1 / gene=Cvel_7927 / organism=Chromera_velia_CCMP2878 / gene_product=hypothetical protein / transcript_product=hypothetical protein / location=Cvel_scaffold425:32374-43357(+) / protein_length=1521 / sequence_SO=supercontig / SO=protein_coding / is_pseudo=false
MVQSPTASVPLERPPEASVSPRSDSGSLPVPPEREAKEGGGTSSVHMPASSSLSQNRRRTHVPITTGQSKSGATEPASIHRGRLAVILATEGSSKFSEYRQARKRCEEANSAFSSKIHIPKRWHAPVTELYKPLGPPVGTPQLRQMQRRALTRIRGLQSQTRGIALSPSRGEEGEEAQAVHGGNRDEDGGEKTNSLPGGIRKYNEEDEHYQWLNHLASWRSHSTSSLAGCPRLKNIADIAGSADLTYFVGESNRRLKYARLNQGAQVEGESFLHMLGKEQMAALQTPIRELKTETKNLMRSRAFHGDLHRHQYGTNPRMQMSNAQQQPGAQYGTNPRMQMSNAQQQPGAQYGTNPRMQMSNAQQQPGAQSSSMEGQGGEGQKGEEHATGKGNKMGVLSPPAHPQPQAARPRRLSAHMPPPSTGPAHAQGHRPQAQAGPTPSPPRKNLHRDSVHEETLQKLLLFKTADPLKEEKNPRVRERLRKIREKEGLSANTPMLLQAQQQQQETDTGGRQSSKIVHGEVKGVLSSPNIPKAAIRPNQSLAPGFLSEDPAADNSKRSPRNPNRSTHPFNFEASAFSPRETRAKEEEENERNAIAAASFRDAKTNETELPPYPYHQGALSSHDPSLLGEVSLQETEEETEEEEEESAGLSSSLSSSSAESQKGRENQIATVEADAEMLLLPPSLPSSSSFLSQKQSERNSQTKTNPCEDDDSRSTRPTDEEEEENQKRDRDRHTRGSPPPSDKSGRASPLSPQIPKLARNLQPPAAAAARQRRLSVAVGAALSPTSPQDNPNPTASTLMLDEEGHGVSIQEALKSSAALVVNRQDAVSLGLASARPPPRTSVIMSAGLLGALTRRASLGGGSEGEKGCNGPVEGSETERMIGDIEREDEEGSPRNNDKKKKSVVVRKSTAGAFLQRGMKRGSVAYETLMAERMSKQQNGGVLMSLEDRELAEGASPSSVPFGRLSSTDDLRRHHALDSAIAAVEADAGGRSLKHPLSQGKYERTHFISPQTGKQDLEKKLTEVSREFHRHRRDATHAHVSSSSVDRDRDRETPFPFPSAASGGSGGPQAPHGQTQTRRNSGIPPTLSGGDGENHHTPQQPQAEGQKAIGGATGTVPPSPPPPRPTATPRTPHHHHQQQQQQQQQVFVQSPLHHPASASASVGVTRFSELDREPLGEQFRLSSPLPTSRDTPIPHAALPSPPARSGPPSPPRTYLNQSPSSGTGKIRDALLQFEKTNNQSPPRSFKGRDSLWKKPPRARRHKRETTVSLGPVDISAHIRTLRADDEESWSVWRKAWVEKERSNVWPKLRMRHSFLAFLDFCREKAREEQKRVLRHTLVTMEGDRLSTGFSRFRHLMAEADVTGGPIEAMGQKRHRITETAIFRHEPIHKLLPRLRMAAEQNAIERNRASLEQLECFLEFAFAQLGAGAPTILDVLWFYKRKTVMVPFELQDIARQHLVEALKRKEDEQRRREHMSWNSEKCCFETAYAAAARTDSISETSEQDKNLSTQDSFEQRSGDVHS